MSDDLVTWLRQALDDDERVANALQERSFDVWNPGPWRRSHAIEGIVDANNYPVVKFKHHEDPTVHVVDHIIRHDPARVLAEVAAKRAILDTLAQPLHCADCSYGPDSDGKPWQCEAAAAQQTLLRLLAQPFADRPGYQESWRPA